MVALDLFLWPMLLPIIPLLVYVLLRKRVYLAEVFAIFLVMVTIVVVYWPLTTVVPSPANIVVKFTLFVFVPLVVLLALQGRKTQIRLADFGLKTEGMKASILLSLAFLPIMLLITFVVHWHNGASVPPDGVLGIISFIEAFTEEFFFRGILFLFLLPRTNLAAAYSVSLVSFVLMHPQHLSSLFLVVTIVQGILTMEICRRSSNLIGAWILHGTNRFYSITFLPVLI
jgi:membrane protease YdiL (CAAX protease family)